MITKRDFVFRGSCFCEKYTLDMYCVIWCNLNKILINLEITLHNVKSIQYALCFTTIIIIVNDTNTVIVFVFLACII